MAVTPLAPSPLDDEAAFTRARQDQAARRMRAWCVFLGVATLVWWPLDAWVYDEAATRATFAWLRLVTLPLHVGLWLVLRTTLARHALALVVGYHVVVVALLAHAMAELGPPSGPWFGYLHIAVAPAIAIPYVGVSRVLGTLLPAASAALVYFVSRPTHLADPAAASALSFMAFVVIVIAALGTLVQRFERRLFYQSLALTRTTATLERLNDSLRDDERKQLARELHDALGQELTAARFAVGLAKGRPDPKKNLEEVERLLARTTQTVRELIAQLRPRALDELGLTDALRAQADEARRLGGLVVEVALALPELGRDREVAVYRFVQEALTNVLRHARASRVELGAIAEGDGASVWVHDDGRGLGAAHDASAWSQGLRGMHERAAALGGRVTLRDEGGARVSLWLPLRGSA